MEKLENKPNPIFSMLVRSIMKNIVLPDHLTNRRDQIARYFARCLELSCQSISVNASVGELAEVDLSLVFFALENEPESEPTPAQALEYTLQEAGIEIDLTPGSKAANNQLSRFSGIDVG